VAKLNILQLKKLNHDTKIMKASEILFKQKTRINNVKNKIEEIYKLGLELGIKKAPERERKLFRESLNQIVMAVVDDIRNDVNETMNKSVYKYK